MEIEISLDIPWRYLSYWCYVYRLMVSRRGVVFDRARPTEGYED
jgi:hypothetical protein